MTCDYCDNQAKFRGKAVIGPPIYVCADCNELGPLYTMTELAPDET